MNARNEQLSKWKVERGSQIFPVGMGNYRKAKGKGYNAPSGRRLE
jgi:hypothetical protein